MIKEAIQGEVKRTGITSVELGERAGVNPQQIRRYLSSEAREIRSDVLEKLLEALGLTITSGRRRIPKARARAKSR